MSTGTLALPAHVSCLTVLQDKRKHLSHPSDCSSIGSEKYSDSKTRRMNMCQQYAIDESTGQSEDCIILAGMYEFDTQSSSRKGGVEAVLCRLHDVGTESTVELSSISHIGTPALFDMKVICSQDFCLQDFILFSCSDGTVRIFKIEQAVSFSKPCDFKTLKSSRCEPKDYELDISEVFCAHLLPEMDEKQMVNKNVEADSICTCSDYIVRSYPGSTDYSPAVCDKHSGPYVSSIVSTLSSGGCALLDVEYVGLGSESHPAHSTKLFQAHDAEAWACCFHTTQDSERSCCFSTGGDDGMWKIWDTRMLPTEELVKYWDSRNAGSLRVSSSCQQVKHPAGVTCIYPLPGYERHTTGFSENQGIDRDSILSSTEYMFLTGCYDGHVRLYDTRNLGRSVSSVFVGGGAWRMSKKRSHQKYGANLDPAPLHDVENNDQSTGSEYLVAAMHAGSVIVKYSPDSGLSIKDTQQNDCVVSGKEKLVYCAEWLPFQCVDKGQIKNMAVLSSYYDDMLQVRGLDSTNSCTDKG